MKFLTKFLSFKYQIIIVVVSLSVIPLILFGFNALRLADQSQKVVDEMKNKLVISMSSEVEEYFRRINEILAFAVPLEKRIADMAQVNKILFSALNSHREIFAIGHIKDRKIISFFGEKINERISKLLKQYERKKWVQISDSYKLSEKYVFDLLYPLEDGNFVYVTFLLEELKRKLSANNIEETGKFALIKDGNIFVGDEILERRFQFLEIDKIIKTDFNGSGSSTEFLARQKRGYQLKGKKVEGVIWQFWVIFTQDIREANSLTRQLKLGMMVVFIGILSVAGIISFSLAKSFSRPISNLLIAVKAGDLETKAHLDKKDKGELALLLKTFNLMIDNLKETRDKLVEKERLAAVGEMANVIGHDIRNPLAAIKNGVYFIRYVLKSDNEKITTSLDIMDREIKSIDKIVSNILGYSRQKPPSLTLVDVHLLIDEVISLVEITDNIEIKKEFTKNLPEYNLDRDEIRQTLINIVNNAIQACDKERGRVEITTSEKNGELIIQIKDNGKGIPKDEMKNMFKAFHSTKEGGTGLGLASAKRIIERHGGRIKLNSIHREGTEVIISIPRKEE